MKNACLSIAAVATGVCLSMAAPVSAQSTRVVAADGRASSVSCEAANPAPRSIQLAVDLSASGDTILVCPGVYAEQVKIASKNLTIRAVTSGALNQVLIKPRGVLANSTNAYSGAPIAAVIVIENTASVILRGLTVDGSDNQLTACAPTLVGVFYREASGEVQSTTVRDIRLGATLEGCASGYGIFAQTGAGGIAKLMVSSSSVHGYQKVGIMGNEPGTDLQLDSTVVTGDGVTTAIAQNGIQIGFGASGKLTGNSVVNHVYSCPTFPCDAATSILVYESNDVVIAGNETAKAAIGIYLVRSDDGEVRNNKVSDTALLDGIAVIGNRNHVHLNRIFNSAEFALSVDGNRNTVEENVITEAPCGIYSSGTRNRLLDNSFFSTELTTCEPFTLFFQALTLDPQARSAFSSGLALGAASAAVLTDATGLVLRAPAPVR